MSQVASGQSCSDASTRSIGRLAPFTTRTLIPAPPRARRAAAHSCSRIIAPSASGRYACSTMPASSWENSGWSSSVVNTATVRSRSRYSSMSRLMNFAGVAAAARRNSGVSESTTCSTASSNAQAECGATVDDTLIDT